MKLNLKNALIATSIAAGLFGASAVAIAQNTTAAAPVAAEQALKGPQAKGDSQGKHRADRMAKMQKRMAERQAKLKAELKLAPEQEAAWSAFVARTAPELRMGGKDRAQREDWSKMTTPERLDKMQARHAERGEKMAERIDATKSFYATLTPEQQKTFDTQSMRATGGKHRGGMKGDHQHMGKNHHHGDHGQGMHKARHQGEKTGLGKAMAAPVAPDATVVPAPAVTQ